MELQFSTRDALPSWSLVFEQTSYLHYKQRKTIKSSYWYDIILPIRYHFHQIGFIHLSNPSTDHREPTVGLNWEALQGTVQVQKVQYETIILWAFFYQKKTVTRSTTRNFSVTFLHSAFNY